VNENNIYSILKLEIDSNQNLEEVYKKILRIAYKIFCKAVEHTRLGVTKEYSDNEESFQKFIYEWTIFGTKQIPFHFWADLAEEGLNLLKEMVETKNLDYKNNPKFRPFCRKIADRIVELRQNPDFQNHFDEFID
jgi:hypothetical protein